MEEAERRRSYQYGRVLIETARVLSPQFSDSLVCLTGAELEMLRNITIYLGRRDTYVSAYDGTYYVIPDDEDWDQIEALVATLEEKLMGCQDIETMIDDIKTLNTPIAATEGITFEATSGSQEYKTFTQVPAGHYRVVHSVEAYQSNTTLTQVWCQISLSGVSYVIHREYSVAAGQVFRVPFEFVLKAGDSCGIYWVGEQLGSTLRQVAHQTDYVIP